MAAQEDTKAKNAEASLNERVSGFLQKNRLFVLIGLGILVLILAGFVITSTVRGKILSNALSTVNGFSSRYEVIKPNIDSGDPEALGKQVVLMGEIDAFLAKNSGLAAARAYSIRANINADQNQWAEAEEAWTKAASAAGKNYLAPVSLFNAAVAAEEQGKTDTAISLYLKALDYGDVFPSAVKAQFSVGRLEESRGNKDAAIEAYRNLLSKWPNDLVWPNLAQNRLLVLSD